MPDPPPDSREEWAIDTADFSPEMKKNCYSSVFFEHFRRLSQIKLKSCPSEPSDEDFWSVALTYFRQRREKTVFSAMRNGERRASKDL